MTPLKHYLPPSKLWSHNYTYLNKTCLIDLGQQNLADHITSAPVKIYFKFVRSADKVMPLSGL